VKFLLDAHLPARLVRLLNEMGHDAVHVTDLPNGSRSTDAEIAVVADAEDRVVVSKDRDFRNSHLIHGSPRRVFAVRTGNISNNELLALVQANAEQIAQALDYASFVELGRDRLVVHGDKPGEGPT
jgi:predicted nuclease of predicted toxin-antitoxin system